MTTTTALARAASAGHETPSAFARVWRIVRLHYANRFNVVALPWLILAFVFLVNLVIWILIASSTGGATGVSDGTQYSGSVFYIFGFQAVFAVQSMNLTFPFALGLASTRRDYFLGTALMFGIQAAAFTIGYTILSYIEQASDGWWTGGHMFQTVYFGTGPLWQRLFTFFAAMLFVLFAGSVGGSVFVRWRSNGLYALGAVVAMVVVGALSLITLLHGWAAVGRWFVDVGATGLVAWLLVPTAVFALLGYLALRRATPKS